MRTALALLLWTGVALAQNSFPTANGSRVEGVVMMCLTAGKAVPCTGTVTAGPDSHFNTAGGATVDGLVQMCLAAGKAVPCTGTVTTGPDSSFTTPGNARVGSIVLMCITGGKAVPCTGTVTTGPDGSFTTPGNAGVGGGRTDVRDRGGGRTMLRRRTLIKGLLATVATPALAQNSFLTPGGSSVPGIVTMCLSSNVAVPCATGGGGSFPPNISGTQATIAADFAGQQYWASATSQASFAAWLTAIGGTYARASSATYLQGGVVQTATANTPRFPTDLGGVAQGIRLTGAATNVVIQSSGYTTASWIPLVSTLTTGQADPAGGTTAIKVIPNAGSVVNPGIYPGGTNPGFTATQWTVAIFAKNAGYNFINVDITNSGAQIACFDLTTGAIITTGTFTATGAIQLANGWWLCYMTCVPSLTGNNPPSIRVSNVATLLGSFSFTADGVSGVSLWGAQITNTAFPTDYIPTTTATVTQAADSFQFPFTQTTFSTLAIINQLGNDPSLFMAFAGTPTNNIAIGVLSPNSITRNNSVGVLTGPAVAGSFLNLHKFMSAGSNAGRSITVDGVTPVADPTALVATAPTAMGIGSSVGGSFPMWGNISQFAIWNAIVASTAEMQRLTT